MKPIRVLVVDDHPLFRQGVASLLREQTDMEIVGEAEDGAQALNRIQALLPDVILMDIQMPIVDGIEATRKIKEILPNSKVIILTVAEEEHSLFEAIKSGADGYLLKKIGSQALLQAIRGVFHGEASISSSMAAKILKEFSEQSRRGKSKEETPDELSPRETEVLDLVTQGQTNKEIAAALAISEGTVKNHMRNIMDKLHLRNRAQAAVYALRQGLVSKKPPSLD
ncbi:MAG: response regulator transcription factor [Candidatus Tectomicrobia bacterium]|uniref:Response regulator transcription factor n=1 Tax=Tectimicrobiota bacterium TaxID=2528274 RepID=A0A932GN89_UNCTE|nr:response regulator transcription factor [Candidatus Tectomicrobia bacterium]